MMPSRGMSQVLKAAATSEGLATQTMNSANRGNIPANSANRQPIVLSLRRVRRVSPRSVKAATRVRHRRPMRPMVTVASAFGVGHRATIGLVLLGVIACTSGDVRTMLRASNEALASASEHGWEASTWSAAATTMIAHAALLRADPSEAQRLAADGLAARPGLLTPPLRFV